MSRATRATGAGDRHVALLRGINVGGKNKLPMAELVKLFTAAGCSAVKTYIQSGNVVFTAAPQLAASLARLIPKCIDDEFGIQVPIILRTAAELGAVTHANPFLKAGEDPATLHVAFLRDAPDMSHAADLDPKRSPGDSFCLRGRDLYLHLPNGVASTRLSNVYLDKTLNTISTVRNWRTVQALLALTQD